MRKIAYNEFIILYIFLIFCKLRYLYLRNLIIIEKPFSIFPVQTELKNIREGFLKNPSLMHISLKQTKPIREGFSIVSIIIEFLQRLRSDRKV